MRRLITLTYLYGKYETTVLRRVPVDMAATLWNVNKLRVVHAKQQTTRVPHALESLPDFKTSRINHASFFFSPRGAGALPGASFDWSC